MNYKKYKYITNNQSVHIWQVMCHVTGCVCPEYVDSMCSDRQVFLAFVFDLKSCENPIQIK